MGRRERLPHIRTGESACPTFVSWLFVGRRPMRDKAEALALQNVADLHPIGTELMTQNTRYGTTLMTGRIRSELFSMPV
jgi:hypothetical protein